MPRCCLSDERKSRVLEASPFSLFISNLVFATRQEQDLEVAYHVHTGNLYTKKSPAAMDSSVAHEKKDVNGVNH